MAEMFGTGLNDILFGTDAADVIQAYGGDDVIDGGLGADYIYAGLGNDRIVFSSVMSTSPPPTTFGLIDGGDGFDSIDARNVQPTQLVMATNNSAQQVLSLRVGTQYLELQHIEEILFGGGNDFINTGISNTPIILRAGSGDDFATIRANVTFYAEGGDDTVFIGAVSRSHQSKGSSTVGREMTRYV